MVDVFGRSHSSGAFFVCQIPFDLPSYCVPQAYVIRASENHTSCKQTAMSISHGVVFLPHLEAQWSVNSQFMPDKLELCGEGFNFFHHHISRDLPIIMYDTADIENVRDHPFVSKAPPLRFYAGAPLIYGPNNYVGTLCIVDHSPRQGFTLKDAEFLIEKAAEVTGILKRRLAV